MCWYKTWYQKYFQGFKVLDKLKEALERKDTLEELSILSSEFYDVIPRNFGTRKKPVIKDTVFFQKEYDTLGVKQFVYMLMNMLDVCIRVCVVQAFVLKDS